jgi:hypothetical protein
VPAGSGRQIRTILPASASGVVGQAGPHRAVVTPAKLVLRESGGAGIHCQKCGERFTKRPAKVCGDGFPLARFRGGQVSRE